MNVVFATCSQQPFVAPDDQPLADALRALGYQVEPEPWTHIDPNTHVAADPVVLRSTWDYHRVPTMFRAWLDAMADSGRLLLNPPEVARENVDKIYLQALHSAGIAIPQTRWIEKPDDVSLTAVLREEGWTQAVVKPRIGATAHGTFLIGEGAIPSEEDLAPARASGAVMQEFIPEIRERGELSLVYAGGEFSHAVVTHGKAGDCRVPQDFGGVVASTTPSPAVLNFAGSVMTHVPGSCVYARVDIVESARGPLLMELELIEPELYFTVVPGSAARMARAIVDRLVL